MVAGVYLITGKLNKLGRCNSGQRKEGNMAGYNNYSMSNNALDAYDNGQLPISKFVSFLKKTYGLKGLTAADVKVAGISPSSWHHTSCKFNRTNFYSTELEGHEVVDLFNAVHARKLKAQFVKDGLWDFGNYQMWADANIIAAAFQKWQEKNYAPIKIQWLWADSEPVCTERYSKEQHTLAVERWLAAGFQLR